MHPINYNTWYTLITMCYWFEIMKIVGNAWRELRRVSMWFHPFVQFPLMPNHIYYFYFNLILFYLLYFILFRLYRVIQDFLRAFYLDSRRHVDRTGPCPRALEWAVVGSHGDRYSHREEQWDQDNLDPPLFSANFFDIWKIAKLNIFNVY